MLFSEVTGRATWAEVRGRRHTALVPLDHADHDDHAGTELHVPYSAEQLAQAPHHDPARRLDPRQEQELYLHYGLPWGTSVPAPAGPSTEQAHVGTDRGTAGTVRSEEQLRIAVERRPYARKRLVTHIVTEDRTFTVPVRRPEVRLEAVPLRDPGTDGPDRQDELREDVHETVLYGEEVVVTTRVVPLERVRLRRHVVTGEQRVTEELRAERVETDRVTDPPTR